MTVLVHAHYRRAGLYVLPAAVLCLTTDRSCLGHLWQETDHPAHFCEFHGRCICLCVGTVFGSCKLSCSITACSQLWSPVMITHPFSIFCRWGCCSPMSSGLSHTASPCLSFLGCWLVRQKGSSASARPLFLMSPT